MKTFSIEVEDDYANKVIEFLKLLPSNVIKIGQEILPTQKHTINLDDELTSRLDDIHSKHIKTLSREEVFNEF